MKDFLGNKVPSEAGEAGAKAAESAVEKVKGTKTYTYLNTSGAILWTDKGKIFPKQTVELTPEQAAGHPRNLMRVV